MLALPQLTPCFSAETHLWNALHAEAVRRRKAGDDAVVINGVRKQWSVSYMWTLEQLSAFRHNHSSDLAS